ncbi:MAG: ribosomal protein S18-alanine N-acetyltransferase [Chitinispirillia bacterium]|nr:ribosomal protein S18-alanine N-acetyltransferase [Chitinispirillia bacterium]MCL2268495.1 ribosomal protein S18-alanine N-acetyltransferase [Chitinispirillia bacterium]
MKHHHSITVRPAASDDLEQIYALEQTCSQNPWSRDGLAEELSGDESTFLLLQTPDEGRIVGFACAHLVCGEMHILDVAIHRDYRNEGLGALLVTRLLAEADAKEAARACLEVRASNTAAIRLYEKCGFMRDGMRDGYYQDGEDAVLMSSKSVPVMRHY